MKNLKDLVEQRNAEKASAEKIYKTATDAKRALKDTEAVKMTEHYRNAKKFNDTLKALKAKRSADKADKKVKSTRGEKTMDKNVKKAKIVRGLNNYLRSGSAKQLRDIDPSYSESGNAGITVPNTIDNNIITKLTEDAPVFNAVRRINSVTGTLTLLKETDTDESGFVGEAKNLKKVSSDMDKVTLTQKRVGAYAELTEDIMNDSAVNLTNYALNRLSWGFGKAIERAILTGGNGGDKSFSPILGNVNHNINLNKNFTTEDILQMTYSINPQYLKNAMFVVSRPVFNQMGTLKDGNGQFLVLRNTVNDTPGSYSFRGIPVFVSDVLNNAPQQIILGNFNAGYAVMVKQGMNIQQITNDTTQALAGGRLIVLSSYMDGGVINPDAFVVGSVGK